MILLLRVRILTLLLTGIRSTQSKPLSIYHTKLCLCLFTIKNDETSLIQVILFTSSSSVSIFIFIMYLYI